MGLAIDLLCGTHGNETLGPDLHNKLSQAPIDGVRSRLAHPEAVKQGKRFLGDQSQLMDHYPGDPSGDPEDVAAYNNMRWLGSRANDEEVLIYDIHNSDSTRPNCFYVGKRALQAGLAGAYLLGHDVCYVEADCDFYTSVNNGLGIEVRMRTPEEQQAALVTLHTGLSAIAALDIAELQGLYTSIAPEMSFYRKIEIPTLTPDGSLSPFLFDLEQTEANLADGRLRLSSRLLNAFGLDKGTQVWAETWNHQNMSPLRPDLGRDSAGRHRRLFFGALLYRIPAPVRDGSWLVFKNLNPATRTPVRVSARTI